jgi:flavorubredoxin
MPAVQIRPNVYWIGVNDRTTDLFEGIWPIEQEGVSYNAYLILDRKKALIDLSKALKTDEFFHQVEERTPLAELDYIVLNHLEPDHTGVIRTLRKLAPQAVILGSAKMKEMLASFYDLTENVRVVDDGSGPGPAEAAVLLHPLRALAGDHDELRHLRENPVLLRRLRRLRRAGGHHLRR